MIMAKRCAKAGLSNSGFYVLTFYVLSVNSVSHFAMMVRDEEKERKMFVGVVWSCAPEFKFLLAALLFLCSIITVFEFIPSPLSFSVSDLRHCVSTTTNYKTVVVHEMASTPPSQEVVAHDHEVPQRRGLVITRAFNPYGTAAYNFILMSAYRGGLNTFSVIGLASKPLHVFGKPSYLCEWLPHPNNTILQQQHSITVVGDKYLPDWRLGHVYTVVVINCTFPVSVGNDPSGGKLLVHASTNGGGDRDINLTDTINALAEAPGSLNLSQFMASPKYDYLYCGSSLYGDLSPQRVREWLAYHVRLFGPRSHFIIHDAGGVHPEVMEVLRPWIDKGYVTLEDIKEQERFDGYYHNQFLVLNDCLHRYRFMTKWMFFFDVDEFIFVPNRTTLGSVMDSLSGYTHVTFKQMPISNKLCLSTKDAHETYSQWGFEKLVYKDIKQGIHRDRKYAVQPCSVFATGVHMSESTVGKRTGDTGGRIMYYHYHGTISKRQEPCQQLINNTTNIWLDGIPHVLDTRMRETAESVKRFELEMIGSVLQGTRQ